MYVSHNNNWIHPHSSRCFCTVVSLLPSCQERIWKCADLLPKALWYDFIYHLHTWDPLVTCFVDSYNFWTLDRFKHSWQILACYILSADVLLSGGTHSLCTITNVMCNDWYFCCIQWKLWGSLDVVNSLIITVKVSIL